MNLIPASYYHDIYLFFVSIVTLIYFFQYYNKSDGWWPESKKSEVGNIIFLFILILFIGLRPVSGIYFVDMANYYDFYHIFYEGQEFNFNWNTSNLIFDNLLSFWGSRMLGTESFFLLICAIYFGSAYLGIRRLFPEYKMEAYFVFLAAFSTFSYGTNGIKAGAASSLFIWAYSYRNELKKCIPLILLSLGFHHSMQLAIGVFVVTYFYKNTKGLMAFWVFCFIVSALHIKFFANIFALFADERGAAYLVPEGGDYSYITGFRLDFILYSSVPIIIGYYAVIKQRIIVSKIYRELLNFYICSNGIWMLCMYASYTNRIAYLSWFLYPILIVFPILYENVFWQKYKAFSYAMLLHLGFTLVMYFLF